MPKSRPPYSPEFRRQMVDLVHAGRDPDELAREFEPTGQSIRACVNGGGKTVQMAAQKSASFGWGFLVRLVSVSSSRPDVFEASRAAAVKDGRRPPRSVLDGGEHGSNLARDGLILPRWR